MTIIDKPPYAVPSMAEIEAIPWNGYNAISTFTGAGGSCLGYRMAGFRILWASEFIPAAAEVYQLNHPSTLLNTSDIRNVDPKDILTATGLELGDLDLLDGSPPCASFSTAGIRSAGWGQVKTYSETKQVVDDLFYEFIRIAYGLQPKVFVAENVSGLVKGKARGYFKEIMRLMREAGYLVEAKLLDAYWLGVPQRRQRLIFVGVRNDLVAEYNVKPVHPKPLPYTYSMREAIPWIIRKREDRFDREGVEYVEPESWLDGYAAAGKWDMIDVGRRSFKRVQHHKPDPDGPCSTILASTGKPGQIDNMHPIERRKFSIAELRRISAFPDDFQLTGTYTQQYERIGRAVPPVMMYHIASTIRDEILEKING